MIETDGETTRSALVHPAPANVHAHERDGGELVSVGRRARPLQTWPAAVAADVLALAASIAFATTWFTDAARAGIALAVFLATFRSFGLYDRRRIASLASEARSLLRASAVATALTGLFVATDTPALPLVALWAISLAACGAVRGLHRLARRIHPVGVLVVGTNDEAQAIANALVRGRWCGYAAIGYVTSPHNGSHEIEGLPLVGTTDRMSRAIVLTGAGAIVTATSALPAVTINKVRQIASAMRVESWTTGLPPRIATRRVRVADLDGMPLLAVGERRNPALVAAAKRAVDIAGALGVLLFTAPLFAAIAAAIKIDDPTGPVFFRQTRVGRNGARFGLVKFRTMVDGAEKRIEQLRLRNEADGLLFKMREDPRITRVGRILRRTSLDELPQLWNVLVGDMSLVGPRPALIDETSRYEGALRKRLDVKPGLTGLWQVSGRQELTWADYIHYDLFYAENWSVALDVAILARTLPAVVRGQGAW